MVVHGEMSREQLVAEVDDLRRRLSDLRGEQDFRSGSGEVPEAPSFAYHNPSPVVRFDSTGTVLTINPAAVELIGPEAMEGTSLVSLLPSMSSVNLSQTIATDSHIDFETEIGDRWFHFVVVGISDYGVGHLYGYDITVRHRAQNALRGSVAEQRRRTREQETLSNIARVIGSSLAIEEVYERFAREVAQLIPFDRIVINLTADRPGYMVDTYQSSAVEVPDRAPDQSYSVEGTLSQAVIDSQRCIVFQPGNESEAGSEYNGLIGAYGMGLRSFLSAPLLYRGEPIGCLNLHSLTESAYSERHRLLAERIAVYIAGAIANAQLHSQVTRQSEELSRSNRELEQFAYVASHDLQEPLRMVSSYVALLGRRYGGQLDERADKYIHFAVDGANRMQGLIHDLLAYSRVGTRGAELVATDTVPVLEETLSNLEVAIAESQAKVVYSHLPWVMRRPALSRRSGRPRR
ncbi:MAG: GAF domain-containing protein, partial [Chloroflexota bacterium]|nr:GAF domain-containing protein [Chloroflexota bacterium]